MDSLNNTNWLLLAGAGLVLIGIASSLVARRAGAPLLLVFLLLGMLLGEDGFGGLRFDNYGATYTLGSLALAIILFDGGLRTRAGRMVGALGPATVLATIGVVITTALTGIAVWWLFGLGPQESLLLGAIVASTDAAAVFFLLHANGLHLQRRVGTTLEIESGSNDPVAVFLTLMLCSWLASDGADTVADMALSLVLQIGIGAFAGVAGGRAMAAALNRLALPAGLHPLMTLAGAVALFSLTNLLHGSGFLAVYLAGIVIGNRPVRAFANVLSVQDAATWLAQLVMFLVLGLLVTPSALLPVLLPALGVAAFLMLVGRPLAVALCLLPFRFRLREIAFVSWVGLRGAVGIFLASVPMLVGLPNAELYFNVAFVVVLVSLLIQGWTLSAAAHWLRVALPRRDAPSRRVELDLPGQLDYEMVGYLVSADAAILRGSQAPKWARPALVVRDQQVWTPEQAGPLKPDDYAYYLAPPGNVTRLDWLFAEASEALEAEREMFGAFTLAGDVPLQALADFYGLTVPPHLAQLTPAELFAQRFDSEPQVGDRLRVGQATLVVRDLEDDQVGHVGLKFGAVGNTLFGEPGASGGKVRRWVAFVGRRLRRPRRVDSDRP